MNAQVLGLVNQKGGVTKSTSCVNLAAGLAQAGKKVLIVDLDPQASATISLGHPQSDQLPVTISDMMGKVLTDQPIVPGEGTVFCFGALIISRRNNGFFYFPLGGDFYCLCFLFFAVTLKHNRVAKRFPLRLVTVWT